MLARYIKTAVLRKGWAGHTLSRKETSIKLDRLLAQHLTLQAAYHRAALACDDRALLEKFERIAKRARLDAGRLAETILSCGGCPVRSGDTTDDTRTLTAVADMERAFSETIQQQHAQEHQIRTRAVLARLAESSEERLVFIRGAIRSQRQ